MELLIALGIAAAVSVMVLTLAWVLIAEHDATEPGSDAFDEWFPAAYATEVSEQEEIAMWNGMAVAEPPKRPDVDTAWTLATL